MCSCENRPGRRSVFLASSAACIAPSSKAVLSTALQASTAASLLHSIPGIRWPVQAAPVGAEEGSQALPIFHVEFHHVAMCVIEGLHLGHIDEVPSGACGVQPS